MKAHRWHASSLSVSLRLRSEAISQSLKVMHRILIIGVSGAGKTTLAEDIALLLNLRFLATDSLYWKAD
jgi:ABC-type iron transport system FetAB ATPase subunit